MTENKGRFQPGNKAAYVHGGRSSKNGDAYGAETVARLKAEALADYPWLASQSVLLELLVSQRCDILHYSAMVTQHQENRRAAAAQRSRDHKAKAESALQATLRQVETARTGATTSKYSREQWVRLGLIQVHAETGDEFAVKRLRELGLPAPGEVGYEATKTAGADLPVDVEARYARQRAKMARILADGTT